ncbi:hypothetical protein MMC07_002443 [Pseudocyphellaria aurata]|nr:hypothetical protein [Pseudocyphellaria aurata]
MTTRQMVCGTAQSGKWGLAPEVYSPEEETHTANPKIQKLIALETKFSKLIKAQQVMSCKVKQEFIDVEEIFDELMGDADFNAPQSSVQTGSSRRPISIRQHSSENPSAGSESGLEIMGRGVKELVQAVQKLRNLGIEALGLPLPKIVVVGDQSTGKSSLIEGISEIKVPRNVGTCTRCPLEINLTESDRQWICEVSLFKKYMYEKRSLEGKSSKIKYEGATSSRPLGACWVLQDSENFPFATLNSKDQVPAALRLAQLATLNPSSPYDKYLPGKADPGDSMQVKFSPNVVRLDISGPGLPNMSFYDLPGVISQPEVPEEQYLVDLVKNLVKEYIKDDSCINLLALPMTDDPTNSTASSLVRDVNAHGRTVGVLTKPDRHQQGESQTQWLEMLRGQRFQLGFGYFVVKNNPDSTIAHATARAEEREYFLREEPWANAWNRHSDHFGTLRLQTFLSQKLTAQILKSLPRVTEQIQRKATAIDHELRTLPEPPQGNLPIVVIQSLSEFESNVKMLIDGDIATLDDGEVPGCFFWKDWITLAMTFRGIMAESRPVLRMDSIDPGGVLTPTKKRHQETIELSDDISDTGNPFRSDRKRRRTSVPSSDKPFATKFSLRQIRDIIREGVPGLPGQIDTRTVDRVIRMSLQKWDKPLDQFLGRVEQLCNDMFMKLLDRNFGCWRATLLYPRVVEICSSFLKDAMAFQRKAAERALQLELHKPASFNAEGLRTAEEKALNQIEADRRQYRASEYVRLQDQRNLKGSNGLSREDRVGKVSDAQLGSDAYSQEVHLIGSVRGYYECAFSRFVDVVCQGIQGELFLSCRNEIGAVMKEQIGILKPDANERCTVLLAMDRESQERRVQLMKEKAVIVEAQDWLEGLTEDADNVLPVGPLS